MLRYNNLFPLLISKKKASLKYDAVVADHPVHRYVDVRQTGIRNAKVKCKHRVMPISRFRKEFAESAKRRCATEGNAGRGTNGAARYQERNEEKRKTERKTERGREREKRSHSDSRTCHTYICVLHARGITRVSGDNIIVDTCLSAVNRIRFRCRSGNLRR